MNCKKFKEIVLTDFIDDQLKDELQKEIDSHLRKCASCKKFYENALKYAVLSLRQAKRKLQPVNLYSKVLEKIYNYEQRSFIYKIFAERKTAVQVISFAAAAMLIIGVYFIGFSVKTQKTQPLNGLESITYIYDTNNGSQGKQETINFGSTAEEFFL